MSIYGSWQEAYEDYIDRGFSPIQAEQMASEEVYGEWGLRRYEDDDDDGFDDEYDGQDVEGEC